MQRSNMRSIGRLLMGVLVGGLIGAGIALLMAPQSGDQVRSMIRDRSNELKDRAMNTVDDTRSRAESAVRSAKSRAEDLVHRS